MNGTGPRTIYDFFAGRNCVRLWLDENLGASAELEGLLYFARAGFVLEPPRARAIHGKKYHGLFEFRFLVNKVQHRVFFCYGRFERGAVILLAGGTHKQGVYDPPSVLDTALNRKLLSESDRRYVVEHEL